MIGLDVGQDRIGQERCRKEYDKLDRKGEDRTQ